MKRVIIFFMLSFYLNFLYSQNFPRNNIFIEFGGNALFTAINFDRQITKRPGFGFRLGAGIYGLHPIHLTIPLGVNYLLKTKKKNSFIDLGFGITWTKANVTLYAIYEYRNNHININYINYIPSIGYRLHNSKNMMVRFNFTPVINRNGTLPFLGLSIGKSF